MMAVVRTSLQKVVVLLHRLQRMAVSSPRYQKLCKVTDWWLKIRVSGCLAAGLVPRRSELILQPPYPAGTPFRSDR